MRQVLPLLLASVLTAQCSRYPLNFAGRNATMTNLGACHLATPHTRKSHRPWQARWRKRYFMGGLLSSRPSERGCLGYPMVKSIYGFPSRSNGPLSPT